MVQATPISFCLKYKPPIIAVMYTIDSQSKKRASKKYIHEIRVDFNIAKQSKGWDEETHDLEKLCEHLVKNDP